jgi:DNA uptake protein ComE-like DNA-binding protein
MRKQSPGPWVSLTRSEYAGAFFMLIIAALLALIPSIMGINRQVAIIYHTDSTQRTVLMARHLAATDSFFKKKKNRPTYWHRLQPEDLEQMGLNQDEANRVYEKIKMGHRYGSLAELSRETGIDTAILKNSIAQASFAKGKTKQQNIIELNSCDTSDLISLPGIGSKTANRIIRFRDALGGFNRKEQILETRFADTVTLKKLLPYFQVNLNLLRKIPIQKAGLETLKKHPYLSEKQARVIIAFRNQHEKLSEKHLQEIKIISAGELDRIMPYLDFNE